MRSSKLLVGLLAAGLLATGCGSDSGNDGSSSGSSSEDGANAENAASQEKLPVPVKSVDPDVRDQFADPLELSPQPGGSADFTEKVEHKLRETPLRRANVEGETNAECPDGVTQKASAVSQSTATSSSSGARTEV